MAMTFTGTVATALVAGVLVTFAGAGATTTTSAGKFYSASVQKVVTSGRASYSPGTGGFSGAGKAVPLAVVGITTSGVAGKWAHSSLVKAASAGAASVVPALGPKWADGTKLMGASAIGGVESYTTGKYATGRLPPSSASTAVVVQGVIPPYYGVSFIKAAAKLTQRWG